MEWLHKIQCAKSKKKKNNLKVRFNAAKLDQPINSFRLQKTRINSLG